MAKHDGHRQRLKQRFLNDGLDNFDEINVLELLLFYAIPRKDTNEIAHDLLEHFGSLNGVLEANAADLEKVPGISENASVFLSLINAVCRYYQVKKTEVSGSLEHPDQYGKVLRPFFSGRRNEMVYALCMDAKYNMICCRLLGEGTINSANISARKVAELALSVNASSVVLAHNHPKGIPVPSYEDFTATNHIAKVLQDLDVLLLDHVLVTDDAVISLRNFENFGKGQ